MITLTHAMNNASIDLTPELIFAIYRSVNKGIPCTFVMANGGAMVPVTESKEEIYEQLRTKAKRSTDQDGSTEA